MSNRLLRCPTWDCNHGTMMCSSLSAVNITKVSLWHVGSSVSHLRKETFNVVTGIHTEWFLLDKDYLVHKTAVG